MLLQYFLRFNSWLGGNRKSSYLLLFLICLVLFSWLHYSPFFADPDSFYHIKKALLMKDGIVKDFPYLPFTTLHSGFIDHHFLYHVYLIPFVSLFPPLIAAKLAHIILDCLVILVFCLILKKMRVRQAFWYAVFLLFCEPFIFRICLVKAQPFSLLAVFLLIYLLLSRKTWWLMFLSFVYVWSYGGWFLALILAALLGWSDAFDKARWNRHNFWPWVNKNRRFLVKIKIFLISWFKTACSIRNLKVYGATFLGLALGIIINPYFPTNLEFYWIHIIKIAFINFQDKIGVGAEWYPYQPIDFLKNMTLPFMIFAPALILFLNYRRRMGLAVKYFFWLVIFFLLATIKSRRNIEYLIPITVAFSALVFSACWQLKKARHDLRLFTHSLRDIVFQQRLARAFILVVIGGVGLSLILYLPQRTKDFLSRGYHFNYLQAGSEFLLSTAQPGDIIFHSDWDDFPALFYYNSQNYYLAGLDPTFMYLYNSDLYWQWADVTMGKRYAKMKDIIKKSFGASFVLATKDHQDFIRNLNNNFYFEKIYEDDQVIIYKVL